MRLDFSKPVKDIKPGMVVWYCNQRYGHMLCPGLVVERKGDRLVAIFPTRALGGLTNPKDEFHRSNRLVFTRRKRKSGECWMVYNDHHPMPMMACLMFPDEELDLVQNENPCMVAWRYSSENGLPSGQEERVTPETAIRHWTDRDPKWRVSSGFEPEY